MNIEPKVFEIDFKIEEMVDSILDNMTNKTTKFKDDFQTKMLIKETVLPFEKCIFKIRGFQITVIETLEDSYKRYWVINTYGKAQGDVTWAFNIESCCVLRGSLSINGIEFGNEDIMQKFIQSPLTGRTIAKIAVLAQIILKSDISDKVKIDYSKLNKKRLKNNKNPLPETIKIVLKRSAEELAKNTIEMHAVNDNNKIGQKRLHDVRSFVRLRLGKVEIVKAHKRGNAELGEVKQVRIVK